SLAYSSCWLESAILRRNIRCTVLLIGTEGGDSSGNSMGLETPQCESTRRLKPCPRKASACSGNQQFCLLFKYLHWKELLGCFTSKKTARIYRAVFLYVRK